MTLAICALAVAVASAAISAIAVSVASRQLRESRRANDFPQAVDLFREYRQPAMVAARQTIFERVPEFDPEKGVSGLAPEVKREAEQVIHYLDNLGFLVAEELTRPEIVAGFLGGSALRVWETMRDLIHAERQLREEPRYQAYFERLATEISSPGVQANLP
jgi:hypothetical protein